MPQWRENLTVTVIIRQSCRLSKNCLKESLKTFAKRKKKYCPLNAIRIRCLSRSAISSPSLGRTTSSIFSMISMSLRTSFSITTTTLSTNRVSRRKEPFTRKANPRIPRNYALSTASRSNLFSYHLINKSKFIRKFIVCKRSIQQFKTITNTLITKEKDQMVFPIPKTRTSSCRYLYKVITKDRQVV